MYVYIYTCVYKTFRQYYRDDLNIFMRMPLDHNGTCVITFGCYLIVVQELERLSGKVTTQIHNRHQ